MRLKKLDERAGGQMTGPAGILINEATGRYHPILFRRAPMPGNGDEKLVMKRYKSIGHHTAGLDTLEQARQNIVELGFSDTGVVWSWDGKDIPAMVQWFT
jgi:hypothetical protein